MELALRYFYIHNTRFYKTHNMMPTVSTMQLNCQLNTSFLKQPSVWHKGLVEQRCQRFFLHKKKFRNHNSLHQNMSPYLSRIKEKVSDKHK